MTSTLITALSAFVVLGSAGLTGSTAMAQSSSQLPAFPTADGFGRYAKGGRGGDVIHVTSLNDSGSGSLRACVEDSGPRICVFDVGGTIELNSHLRVRNPYLTIAGQTAPGNGVLLRDATLIIQSHDVIVRHVRLRAGERTVAPTSSSSLSVQGPDATDIIADHVSASWHTDENSEIWDRARNVTYQWSIFSEGLNCTGASPSEPCHSKGLLTGNGATRYSILKSLFAHNLDRNPFLTSGDAELINNVVYNYGPNAAATSMAPKTMPMHVNVIGNNYIPGPDSHNKPPVAPPTGQAFSGESTFYTKGNRHPKHRPNDSLPENAVLNRNDAGTMVSSRISFPGTRNETTADQAKIDVLTSAGATMPRRDAVDLRVVKDVTSGTGRIIDGEGEVGGFPNLANAKHPAGFDTDRDGIADAWELDYGLDPDDAKDGNLVHSNGYTNVENYLNQLAGDSVPGLQQEEQPSIPEAPTNVTVTAGR